MFHLKVRTKQIRKLCARWILHLLTPYYILSNGNSSAFCKSVIPVKNYPWYPSKYSPGTWFPASESIPKMRFLNFFWYTVYALLESLSNNTTGFRIGDRKDKILCMGLARSYKQRGQDYKGCVAKLSFSASLNKLELRPTGVHVRYHGVV